MRYAHPHDHDSMRTPKERYLLRCTSVMQLRHPENFFSFLRLPSHGRKLLPSRGSLFLGIFLPLKSPQTNIEKSHGGQMSSNLQVSTVLWYVKSLSCLHPLPSPIAFTHLSPLSHRSIAANGRRI